MMFEKGVVGGEGATRTGQESLQLGRCQALQPQAEGLWFRVALRIRNQKAPAALLKSHYTEIRELGA